VLVTEDDARRVAALDPSLQVVTIPNGVDAGHFAPRNAPRGGILFTGALDAPSNEQAALRLANRIMPLVRREVPDAHLTIAGRNPGPAVRALEHVIPDVPDLRPYLWGAAVYACPMESGTGIKNKLLEAMAAGAPAVATTLACQGIDARHVVVADTDEEIAAGLVTLLKDRQRAEAQADAARAYVRERHDWDAVAAAYLALYRDIA
jgi:glycosyltransferase involved in cell wall biosynthesis